MSILNKILRSVLNFFCFLGLGSKFNNTQSMRHSEVIDFVLEKFKDKNIRILDVGCGNCNILKGLHERGYKNLNGCDWLARESSEGYSYLQVDLNKNGLSAYEDKFFDLVISSDVIEHLENPTFILKEINRVLKEQGQTVITIPNAWNIQERLMFLLSANSSRYKSERRSAPFGHISFFTTEILESLFDRAHLEIKNILPGDNYFLGYKLRLPRKLIFSYNVLINAKKT